MSLVIGGPPDFGRTYRVIALAAIAKVATALARIVLARHGSAEERLDRVRHGPVPGPRGTLRVSLPAQVERLRERLREPLGQRGIALVLTLAIEALLVLAILTLGIAPEAPKPKPGSRLATFTVEGAKPEREQAPEKAKNRPALAEAQARPQPASPSASSNSIQPPASVPSSPAFIQIPSNQMAGFSIANLPRQPSAPGPRKAVMGPAFTPLAGDSKRIGTAPGGQPLYAAAWYREPEDSELAGYLSTADGPGYALIACRTVADWRIEDCVALDEYPSGSNIARSVLAAAWQFRVRPPRLGGVYKVGEWVRIRIDYGISSARRP
jgi:protein TonB